MPLQTDYRPNSWELFEGNHATIASLKSNLQSPDHNHVMLFTGPSGTGKTTLARLVGRCVMGEEDTINTELKPFAYREINCGTAGGKEQIVTLERDIKRKPITGRASVFFFEEAHRLTPQAQEALLKVMEDGVPVFAYLLFATTDPEKFKTAFRRRCAEYHVEFLSRKVVIDFLRDVWLEEREDGPDEKVLKTIAQKAKGSIGDALKHLDTVINLERENMLECVVKYNLQDNVDAVELCHLLLRGSTWTECREKLKLLRNKEAEGLRRMVYSYMSKVLLDGDNLNAAIVMQCFDRPVYDNGFDGLVRCCYEATRETLN